MVRSDTGEVVKRHSTREKALAHLRALKANVEESAGVLLGVLLEGFSEELHPRGWHGRFRRGDRVRVEGGGVKGERSIVGRVVRPSDAHPESHVVIAPESGGPHVLARIDHVKLDTPERHATERTYRERRMERAQRLRGWADSRESKAKAGYEQGHAEVSRIPLGEPIHGPSDRRRRERSFAKVERSVADQRKAESMRGRADEIERQASRATYSDDPNAEQQLKSRIAELEAERDRVKAYNASARKAAKSGGTGDASLLSDKQKQDLEGHRRAGRPFIGPGDAFPPFVLSNLNGNISRLRKRLGGLPARAQESDLLAALLSERLG